ncbi:autotransporter outer membrane beta-barrel domain-containing protein (plasmid) [Mesorhizobium sp. ISC11]
MSRLALRSAVGVAAAAGATLLAPGQAWSACFVVGAKIQCDNTTTIDTTYPDNPPNDRAYSGAIATPIILNIDAGTTVSGNGLAVSNTGAGGLNVTNNGTISIDAGNMPTAGGTAALSLSAAGGVITYTGGSIINNGTGNAFDAAQTGGAGSVDINIAASVSAATGEGITVRDVATSTGVSVKTNNVSALAFGKDAIDAQSQSLTGNIAVTANGDLQAGNAGLVAVIVPGAATGNIEVTTNGSIDARFGIDAENLGTGRTTVVAGGPIAATTGNGIFAASVGSHVIVAARDVTATGNTAIVAWHAGAGAGAVDMSANNVSGTTGIVATNNGTGTVGVTATGTITGTLAEGIVATGNNAVSVSVLEAVTGATNGLTLIGGTGGGGDISVTGVGGFVGGTGDAANILNNGAGTLTVDIAGASNSAGGHGIYVRDTALGGDIGVTTGAVTALALGKDAIDAQSQSLTGNIAVTANGDLQAGNAGLVAVIVPGAATGNIEVTTNGSIDARFGIDAENLGTGRTTVVAGGPIAATTGNGIFAASVGSHVIVAARDVTATGNTAIVAWHAGAGAGAVDMSANNVSGTTGIVATNNGTGTVGVTATGTITGTLAEGIVATGNNAVSVSVLEAVTGATNGLTLIGGTGGGGDISVTGVGGFVGGTGDAANILNNGAGTLTVDIAGASNSTGGHGIYVRDTALGGDIGVTTGAVSALAGTAIDVQTRSETSNLDVTANGAIDGRSGISAVNLGGGTLTVTAAGPVTATGGGSGGIFAQGSGGNIKVTAGDVTATGFAGITAQMVFAATAATVDVTTGNVSGTRGIAATTGGTGAITVTTAGMITGTLSEGILAAGGGAVTVNAANTVTGATDGLELIAGTGGAGDILVTGAGGFAGGSGDAANILNNGSGTVSVNISGASSSMAGKGIVVRDTAAGGAITVTTGAVTALAGSKDAIDIQAQSTTGNVTALANGDIKSGNAGIVTAIFPAAATGNINVTANGAIGARFGVDAENLGSGSTTVKTVGPVTATSGNGVYARTTGGSVLVNAGAVSSTDNTAIIARQTNAAGAGTVGVTTTGAVSGLTGIEATNSGTGTVTVTANSAVTGTAAEGIKATGAGVVNVNVAGTASGVARGVTVTGSSGTITNTSVGTIRNSSGLLTDSALVATGGPFVLANAGFITGTVTFGAAADTFNNNGTWRTAGGTSDFGGGGDTMTNGPGSIVDAAGVGGIAITNFTNLAMFVNQGRTTVVNGFAGDVLNTSGNAQFGGSSVYAVDIGGVNQSDKFVSTGTTTLAAGSTLEVHMVGNLQVGAHYKVLTADGGLTGEFGSVTGVTNTAFLTVNHNYDAYNAYLDVAQVRDFADAGLTPNQIATGEGLDSLTGGAVFNAVAGLATDAEARTVFDQLSGEIHASAKGMLVEDSRFVRDAATSRVRAAFGDVGTAALPVMAYGEGGPEMVAADTDRFAVWGQAFGSWGNTDSDGNAAAFDRSTGGLLAGADTLVGGWRVGLLGGYSHANFDADDRSSRGDADNYHLGLYGGTNWGAIAFRTGGAYSWSSLSTKRSVAFNGFADQLSADYDAGTAQIFGELAYKVGSSGPDAEGFMFEPFVNLAYVSVHTDGFTEKGGAAALTSAGSTTDATFTTLGLRGSTGFALGNINATALGMLGWRHAFGDTTPLSTVAFAGSDAFTIAGVPIATDSAVIEAGIDLKMSANATLALSYSGQFGGGAVDNGAKLDLAVKF